jgi:hypothetical protein
LLPAALSLAASFSEEPQRKAKYAYLCAHGSTKILAVFSGWAGGEVPISRLIVSDPRSHVSLIFSDKG